MKNHTRLPLLVTAAVFVLTACAPAADSTPAAESTAAPETTAEPTAEPAAETGPLYGMTSRYSQSVVYAVLRPMTQPAGSALTCRPARQRPGTCPPRQPPHRTPPVILP